MKFKILKYYLVTFFLLFFIFIYGLELYLYSSSIPDLENRLRKHYLKTHKNYDKRTKIEIFDQLKNNNVTIAISPRSNLDSKSILPLAGMPNIETIHCKESNYYSIYLSDRYGFNNPDNQWDEQIIDYLIIGDSFTQGACVNWPHDISSVLRTFYNKSSLNLGYSGNGPLIEYATLKEYLRPNVKKILMIFYEGNDLQDLNNELNSKILNLYLNNPQFSQNLKNRQYEINKLLISTIKKEYENQLKI